MTAKINAEISFKLLEQRLIELGPIAVAVSGGVDSMTLAVIANRVDSNNQMYHAVSPAVPVSATQRVKHYANQEGWQLHVINAGEIDDEQYRKNPVNRCYFCKTSLYATLREKTQGLDSEFVIASGTNLDDLNDFRPGLKAAEEHRVVHPYVDVGIDKNTIRAIAKYLNLEDLHELPAAPCLSSRVTTGIAIDQNLLPIIDRVETLIWQDFGEALALTTVRCRILPGKVSIQLQGEVDFDFENYGLENNGLEGNGYVSTIQSMVRALFSEAGYTGYRTVALIPTGKGVLF